MRTWRPTSSLLDRTVLDQAYLSNRTGVAGRVTVFSCVTGRGGKVLRLWRAAMEVRSYVEALPRNVAPPLFG